MVPVLASSYSIFIHCLTPSPYYTPRKNFFKPAFFSGRLCDKFYSLSFLFCISSDLVRHRKEKHSKTLHDVTLSLAFRLYDCHFKYVHFCSQSQLTPFVLSKPKLDTILCKSILHRMENHYEMRGSPIEHLSHKTNAPVGGKLLA